MGKRGQSAHLELPPRPVWWGLARLPPPSEGAQSPCFAGSGPCPNCWAALPGSLHNPHPLHPATWANTLDVDCPHQKLPQTPSAPRSAAPTPGSQSVMTG